MCSPPRPSVATNLSPPSPGPAWHAILPGQAGLRVASQATSVLASRFLAPGSRLSWPIAWLLHAIRSNQAGVGFCAPAWGGGETAPSSSVPPLHCPAPLSNPPPPPLARPSLGSLFLGQTGTCPLQGFPPSSWLSGSWHPRRGGRRRSGGVGVTSRLLARWKGSEFTISHLESPEPTGTSVCVGVCIGLRGLLNCFFAFWVWRWVGRPGEVPEAQDGWGRFQGLSAATGLRAHPPTKTLEAPHSQCG